MYSCKYMESRKNDTDEPIFSTGIETQTQRTDIWIQEPGKEGDKGHMERVTWKYTLPYAK